MAVPVVALVGVSGSGKTRLAEGLIRALRAQGVRVAYVKHCHHGFELDGREKDSGRAGEAGAEIVAMVAPEKTAKIEKRRAKLQDLLPEFGERVDIVLAEGFRSEPVKKIEVVGPDGKLLCASDPNLVAIVSDVATFNGVPTFSSDQADLVAEFLRRCVMSEKEERMKVELEVNGSSVDLNDFVKSLFGTTVAAMVSNLRVVEDAREIRLTIRKPKGT